MAGLNPLQFTEIKAYFDLVNITPFDWEIMTIIKLDRIAVKAHNQNQSQPASKPKVKTK